MSDDPDDFDNLFAGLGPVGDGDPADGRQAPPLSPAPPDGRDFDALRRAAALPLNDFGNAQRFVTHFGRDLLFIGHVGWHVWTGSVWASDDEIARGVSPLVRSKAHQMGALIEAETQFLEIPPAIKHLLAQEEATKTALSVFMAASVRDKTPEDRLEEQRLKKLLAKIERVKDDESSVVGQRLRHAKNAGNSGPLSAMISEASVSLARSLEVMDATPLDINTLSGVMRFWVQKGSDGWNSADMHLMPHAREHLLTKIMPINYDPAAESPLFDAFMARVQPDPNMRAYIQRWLGLSLTGVPVQKLAFWYGAGANGKSVLIDLISRIMGNYAATAKIESLTGKNKRSGGDATPDLVPLIGARLVRASEPEEGERFQEGLIKELTGGEPILVRALHSDFVQVKPYFKLTISGNHKPEIRGTDDGIWRRLMLVPWDVQIPEKERDVSLGDKLWDERSGILNWLAAGLIAYLEEGLQEPAQVVAATQEFREESDPVGGFLAACCHVSGDERDRIAARDLGEAFNFWRGRIGENEWKLGSVARKLKEKSKRWKSPVTGRGFTEHKSSTMSYIGIAFVEPFGRDFRDAPRDQQGRILRSRSAGDT